MLARAYCLHPYASAFEVGNAADPLVPQQFETADMQTGEGDDWQTGLDRDDVGSCIVQAEIYRTVCDRSRYWRFLRCGFR